MRVLIGGGTGFVGHHLSRRLAAIGYSVTLVSRTSRKDSITWNDLYRVGLPDNTVAVVNLAGENLMTVSKRFNDDFKSSLISSRVDTTRQMVQAITNAKNPPKVWVSASAIGYYPPSRTKEYDEYSVEGAGDFFAELVSKWEKAAILPANVSSVRHVTTRIGLVLGRDGGIIKDLYWPFFLGVGGHVGLGQQWFPWVHVDDVVGIIEHALKTDTVKGVLNAVAPQVATNADFTTAFARALNRPAMFPVPEFALRLVYGSERAAALTQGQKVIPKRTLESGYQFHYPNLDMACKECARFITVSELR